MAQLNPTQAHEQWGISKSMLYRDMNNGDLSFTKDDSGKRFIETSELLRQYGEPKKSTDDSKHDSDTDLVRSLREIIERQDRAHSEHLKTLQSQVDSYQEQMNKLLENQADTTKLLIHLQDSIEKPAEAPQPVVLEPVVSETPRPNPEQVQQQAKRKKSLFGRLLAAAIED